MTFVYPDAIRRAAAALGDPYMMGGKGAPAPDHADDCSGFAAWVLSIAGVSLPAGSFSQIKVCAKLPAALQEDPPALALGFFASDGVNVDHVVVAMGAGVVLEARGAPYNCVICRPVEAWVKQPGFLGFYAPPGLTLDEPGTP